MTRLWYTEAKGDDELTEDEARERIMSLEGALMRIAAPKPGDPSASEIALVALDPEQSDMQ